MTPKMAKARCEECPIKDGVFVPPEQHPAPRFVILGEGPWKNEAEKSRPFCGLSGRILDKALSNAKLLRRQATVLNATQCYPGRKLSQKDWNVAVNCCRPAVNAIIGDLPVLALGEKALTSREPGMKGIMKWIGVRINGTFPVFHPAAASRGPALLVPFNNLVVRFGQILNGTFKPLVWPKIVIHIDQKTPYEGAQHE